MQNHMQILHIYAICISMHQPWFFDRSVALDRLEALLAFLEYRLYENFSSRGTRTIIIHPVNFTEMRRLETLIL